jgi:hypothetical protein
MRRFTLAAGVACAILLSAEVGAQNGGTMPGQTVGTYRGGPASPVGQRAPAAAPQLGTTLTGPNGSRPYDPNRPYDALKGTSIDPSTLVAPLVGADGKPVDPPDALDKLSDRIRGIFGLLKPNPPRPAFAPGITRRTTERAQKMWRRD